jgi:hypothetical protein
VKVEDLEFPTNFMILDIGEDEEHPIILGRPFLATSMAIINMNLAELTLRSRDERRTIKYNKGTRDECYKLEWRKKEAAPSTSAQEVHVKVEIEELEEEMAQLQIEASKEEEVPEGLTNIMKRLTIEVDIQAPWVKTWGRNRKVAKRSKFGVNTPPLKKPAAEGKKERFKRVDKENNRWVGAQREQKKEDAPRGKGKSIIKTASSEDDGGLCFVTFKEQQNP